MSWLVILALIASLAGGSTVYASGEALPGDALYSVKLAVEDARLFLSDNAGDVNLHIEFLQTRRDEIQTLIVAGRGDDLPLAMETFSAGINEAAQALAAVAQDDPARAAALAVLLEQALSVHTQVLTVLLDIVPEEAKTAIEQAIIASSKGQEIVHDLFEGGIPGGPLDEIPAPPITPPMPTGLPGGVPPITPPVPTGLPGGAPPITPPVPTGLPGGAPPITPPVPTGLPGGAPPITPPVPTGLPGGVPSITPPVPTGLPPALMPRGGRP